MDDFLKHLDLAKLIPATIGSAVSLGFFKGLAKGEKVAMAVGGSALSYYGASKLASIMGMADAEGLVGFLLGLLGMAVVAKIYEAIQATDFKEVLREVLPAFFRRRPHGDGPQKPTGD